MSVTPPSFGPSFEPLPEPHPTPVSDNRLQPQALRALSEVALGDASSDPVNLVRRLQRSLQLRERDLELSVASVRDKTLAKRVLQLNDGNPSR